MINNKIYSKFVTEINNDSESIYNIPKMKNE